MDPIVILTVVYVPVALTFHAYVAWKVRGISKLFNTDEGIQGFSDRIMRAWIFSALTIPAHFFKAFGAMKEQVASKAAEQAGELAKESVQKVAAQVSTTNGKKV